MIAFIIANLEYIVAGAGAIGTITIAILKTKKTGSKSNDLTSYVIKLNKQKTAITDRTKGVL
jgi:hypothetical protein